MRSPCIDQTFVQEIFLAGHLDETAVAAVVAATNRNITAETGIAIGPNDDLAAVAICGGIGVNLDILANKGTAGILHIRVLAL